MDSKRSSTHFDAIVIGGSYAGQSAAMQLARARRRVLVADAGMRRNRFAALSRGLIGQDGRAPEEIAADGKAQLLAYPNVQWLDDIVVHAKRADIGFVVQSASGQHFDARGMVLAFGVVDEIPDLEGVAERWGRSVYHCPYCHGYELNEGRIGVLGNGPISTLLALLMPDWGATVLLTNGTFEPDDGQRDALAKRSVAIEPERVTRVVDTASVELADGRCIVLDGLFTMNRTRLSSPVAQQLGCAIEEGPLGPYIHTDESMETSVPGVFACGDVTHRGGSVALAVGSGALAGIVAHRKLVIP
ncbi:NAD(P)/FAD-dependent oxidoreductase [Burkholderia sp. TSV86]|uniref:NAD(P)/FAD-dependent oxidoreductase n=1 Tax=Burkholderia sp. TSV86 TaxID=1385594 RepID=UPI0007577672|nr:NAD(P)/FAD-dependent oxidoreductase [Burkholderia sp. TSV86]KVE37742.1 thioredoxin reductase [Burkholderia sp. TSV86]